MALHFNWIRATARKPLLASIGYSLLLGIFISMGWRIERQLNTEIAAQGAVNHTYQVLMELDALFLDLTRAETGQRGFLITGNEQYLEPYTAAVQTIQQHRAALQALTADNARQQARLAGLQPLIDSKLAELARTIALRRTSGLAAAAAEVRTHQGKLWMDRLHQQITSAQAEEHALLRQRAAMMHADRFTLRLLLLLGTLGGVGLLGVLVLAVGQGPAEPARRPRSMWSRYGMAVAMSLVICLGLWLLHPLYGEHAQPLVGISLAVAVAGWWGGLGPGLLTTALCVVFSWWALRQTAYTFAPPDLKESLGLLITIFSGAAISALAEATQRATARLQLAAVQLREFHHKLETVVNSINDGLLVLDKNWRYTYFSEPGARLLGMHPDQLIGQCVWDVFPHAPGSEFYRGYHRAVATGQPVRFEEYYPAPLNRWFECHCYPSADGLSVYFHDISLRKQAEAALRVSEERLAAVNAELEQKVQQRTADLTALVAVLEHFSYSTVHEMRAPLRALASYAELLRRSAGISRPTDHDYLDRIRTSAKQMDELLVDAIAFVAAARTDLPLSPVDPAALLQTMLMTYPDFQQAPADIRSAGALPMVLANRAGLMQCFFQLLRNALKFVPAGVVPQVRISAEVHAGVVRLWFADNGIGIAPEFQGRLFKMFERASRDYAGTGIGLAVVQMVTHRMGGAVGVESQPGHGSRFWIELKATGQA